MNRLLSRAPHTVLIDGNEHAINSDFRDCMLTVLAIESEELVQMEKATLVMCNMFGCERFWPENTAEAVNQALQFLSGGRERKQQESLKLFDWDTDAERLNSALLAQGINLDEQDYMHWWTFLARIPDLPESGFTRIVYLRYQNQRGKLTKEERKECDLIGWHVIRLEPEPEDNSDDEDIWRMLQGGE